jgi:hypothetical protein
MRVEYKASHLGAIRRNRAQELGVFWIARSMDPTITEDPPPFDPLESDALREMVEQSVLVFSNENFDEIDSCLSALCQHPHYLRELPALLDSPIAAEAVDSLLCSILSLIVIPHSFTAFMCATIILLHLSVTANTSFFQLIHKNHLLEIFDVFLDPLRPLEPDVRASLPEDPSLQIRERFLYSFYWLLQAPEISNFPSITHYLATNLYSVYWSSDDFKILAIIFLDIAVLVHFHYSTLGEHLTQLRVFLWNLPDRHLPHAIPLFEALWVHEPFTLVKLAGGAELRMILEVEAKYHQPWEIANMPLADLDLWCSRRGSLLRWLLHEVFSSGCADWITGGLELLILFAGSKPESDWCLMLHLLYFVIPFQLIMDIARPQAGFPPAQRLFPRLCRKLMQSDVHNIDFPEYFLEIGVIERLNALASGPCFAAAQKAMRALVSNMPQFGPAIIEKLLEGGFLQRFAELYPSMRHTSDCVRALREIVEFVNKCGIAEKAAFSEQMAELGMWEIIGETNAEWGDDYDEPDLVALGEELEQMSAEINEP